MLKELISEIIFEQLKKELVGKNSELIPDSVNRIIGEVPLPRRTNPMIDTTGPLFFSPEEQSIIDLVKEKGPLKQTGIISALSNEMNANTVKELLANLVRRRVLFRGPNGYESI